RWRGFPDDLTPFDHRVILPAPCCLCGEHWSMFHSEDLKWYLQSVSGPVTAVTLDGNGEPQTFTPGSEITEALYVRGDSPNYVPRGSRIIIKAELGDESVLFTNDITVASTRIVKNVNDDVAQSIDARLELANGTYTVKTDREKLVPFYLLSDALLDGNFHLTLGGEPGAFKVWSGDSTNSTLLLECGQTIINGNPHFFAAMDAETQVWLEVLKPGPCEIAYGFTGTGNAEGISFSDTVSITAQWELKVQLMAENVQAYIDSIGSGLAVNTDVNWSQLNFDNIMQHIAALYSNDTRGAGIEMTWAITSFTMPVTPFTYESNNESIPDLYKHTGTIEYNGIHSSTITGGSTWITFDHRLHGDNEQEHATYFPEKRTSVFIATNRNDTTLRKYVKVILPSRTGERLRNGQVRMTTSHHAETHFDATTAFFQGAHIDVVNIAEENFVNNGAHYDWEMFIAVLEYCIAHEIFHLVAKEWHGLPPVPAPLWNQPGPLGWPPRPLDKITIAEEEILQIDLPTRASVLPPNP
ncbi:MAG: hypothetical protein FWH21_08965, partial [Kiritimatiellaeota bacterium]|nr:hypothetical protein [Kiritimatiellota bacterium]